MSETDDQVTPCKHDAGIETDTARKTLRCLRCGKSVSLFAEARADGEADPVGLDAAALRGWPRTEAGKRLAATLETVPHAQWKPERRTFLADILAIEAEASGVAASDGLRFDDPLQCPALDSGRCRP